MTLHTPLTEKTKNLIDASVIESMKDGVYIVNCARGGLVDEVALRNALESGKVAGAAIDVFTAEPAVENVLCWCTKSCVHAAPWCLNFRSTGKCCLTGCGTNVRLFGKRCSK